MSVPQVRTQSICSLCVASFSHSFEPYQSFFCISSPPQSSESVQSLPVPLHPSSVPAQHDFYHALLPW